MDPTARHDPIPAALHDVAAVLIVRHLDRHRPEAVVRCLFDSYQRLAGRHTQTEHRIRDAERMAQRRLTARSADAQAWRPTQPSIAS